jgi:hypothetical protein
MFKYGNTEYKISDKKRGVIYDEEASLIITTDTKKQEIVGCVGDSVKTYTSTEKFRVIKPFSHPRTLISDFIVAEKILQYAIKTGLSNNFAIMSPTIIIHPMEKLEGGEINMSEYSFKSEREQPNQKASSMTHKVFVGAVIFIVTAIMFSPIIFDLIT